MKLNFVPDFFDIQSKPTKRKQTTLIQFFYSMLMILEAKRKRKTGKNSFLFPWMPWMVEFEYPVVRDFHLNVAVQISLQLIRKIFKT
jgi:hypothetical protein